MQHDPVICMRLDQSARLVASPHIDRCPDLTPLTSRMRIGLLGLFVPVRERVGERSLTIDRRRDSREELSVVMEGTKSLSAGCRPSAARNRSRAQLRGRASDQKTDGREANQQRAVLV